MPVHSKHEIAALFAEAGVIVITAFISPYRGDRDLTRRVTAAAFHEVFVDAPVEICEDRDKGLYAKARKGEIADLTGISAPYERPEAPELVVPTDRLTVGESLEILTDYVGSAFPVVPGNHWAGRIRSIDGDLASDEALPV